MDYRELDEDHILNNQILKAFLLYEQLSYTNAPLKLIYPVLTKCGLTKRKIKQLLYDSRSSSAARKTFTYQLKLACSLLMKGFPLCAIQSRMNLAKANPLTFLPKLQINVHHRVQEQIDRETTSLLKAGADPQYVTTLYQSRASTDLTAPASDALKSYKFISRKLPDLTYWVTAVTSYDRIREFMAMKGDFDLPTELMVLEKYCRCVEDRVVEEICIDMAYDPKTFLARWGLLITEKKKEAQLIVHFGLKLALMGYPSPKIAEVLNVNPALIETILSNANISMPCKAPVYETVKRLLKIHRCQMVAKKTGLSLRFVKRVFNRRAAVTGQGSEHAAIFARAEWLVQRTDDVKEVARLFKLDMETVYELLQF